MKLYNYIYITNVSRLLPCRSTRSLHKFCFAQIVNKAELENLTIFGSSQFGEGGHSPLLTAHSSDLRPDLAIILNPNFILFYFYFEIQLNYL